MGVHPQREMSPEISIRVSEAGRRYEAVLRISEALSACREPEDLTRILSEQLGEFLDFFQFYIIVYKENSTEVEWAVVGSEKSLMSAYADVPVQERPSWRAYATQEPFQIADWDADERVPARLKQGIAAQGLHIGPLVFVPLTTQNRRLGALGMSGPPSRNRFKKLFDAVKYLLEILAVLLLRAFKILHFSGQVLEDGQVVAETHEGAHDETAHFYGGPTCEDRRQHRHAVLGEGVGWPAESHLRSRIGGRNLRPPIFQLLCVQLKHEI